MNIGKRTGICQWPGCKDKPDNKLGKYCGFHGKEMETKNRHARSKKIKNKCSDIAKESSNSSKTA